TYTAERKIETPAKSYLIKVEYEIRQPGYLERLGILTIVSVIASAIIIGVLFYLIRVLRNRYDEIANMKHSFHGAIHDLKSPLAFTFFTLSSLEEDETDARKKAALSAASDRVSYLTDKIMRLLQTGRNIEKIKEKDKETVFLYDVLALIETEMRTMFPNKDIRFENSVDADLFVRAMPDLMEAAIRILIENAVKYNDDKPVIEISAVRESNTVKIAISDNGIGITEKEQKYIFEPYYTSDQKHGTGIGLNYAQRITKAHNGNISVQSAHGKGSTFIITIPIS
ncbi:MAG: HAMP domain-containing sensor histidine kinase, partial [Proteiniphilum sp.]|nr:HAMP domain-containing sensor histidine kinase [Proteiniphilum sp.]